MRLLTLPVTVIRVPLEFGFGVAKRAAGMAYGIVAGGEETRPTEWEPRPSRAPSGNGRAGETPVAAPQPEPPPPVATEPPAEPEAPPEPAHVSEEPELVAEVAEEGAEEGAGAEITIDEPWPGYDRMKAADIADRLLAEGTEVAATVSLYESARKGRTSVLEAASRSLRD
jgi:hypothetical protein